MPIVWGPRFSSTGIYPECSAHATAPRQVHRRRALRIDPLTFAGLGEAMVTAEIAKRLLASHGDVRPQPPADWTGTFPLPLAVEKFYREVGAANITIAAHGNPYLVPCL